MKKKMALLLVLAMVVTTSITVPFVSFADSTTSNVTEITGIYGKETVVKAAPVISADTYSLSAEFTYTPVWNSEVMFSADRLDSVKPAISVTNEAGNPIEAVKDVFTLDKGVKYSIVLKYTFRTKIKSDKDLEELGLKTRAASSRLTTREPVILKDVENKELWYEISVDNSKNKGMVFSLLSADENATAETKTDYCAQVYDGDKCLGSSVWNKEYAKMFECPLILSKGTYYVKICPDNADGAKANLKLSATPVAAAEIDVNDKTQTVLPENTAKTLDLYSFSNRDGSYYWYKFVPNITDADTARYQLEFSFLESTYGEVTVELDRQKNVSDREEILSGEFIDAAMDSNIFYVDLRADSTYFLQLNPTGELPHTQVQVTIKPHNCENYWFVSDGYSQEVSYGCPCGADDSIIATCTIETKLSNLTYTGQEMMPEPKLEFVDWWTEDGGSAPYCNLDGCYTVTYKDNKNNVVPSIKNVGVYKVIVSFGKSIDPNSKNSLEGMDEVVKTMRIVPVGTTLKNVTGGQKSFTVKWKKQANKTTGYQIQYCTSNTFKNAKTVTVTKNTTLQKKISKLKAKKKYYVRVRTYKTVKNAAGNNVKCYSAWSKYKKVTTK